VTDPDQRIVTAHHEAGHVIARLEAGLTFRYVTIRAKGTDVWGRVQIDRPRAIGVRAFAVIAMAGPAAELLYGCRLDDDPTGPEAGVTLEDEAAAVGMGIYENSDHYEITQARAVPCQSFDLTISLTVDLLQARWADVTTVADALLASPRALTYGQVVALL
jgi:hypothetical protein